MSKSTNTKDELNIGYREILDGQIYNLTNQFRQYITPKEYEELVDLINRTQTTLHKSYIKDRQQLIQRIKEEVIGENEANTMPFDKRKVGHIYATRRQPNPAAIHRNKLRQTQREILETMERDV